MSDAKPKILRMLLNVTLERTQHPMQNAHPQFAVVKNTFDQNEGKGAHLPQSLVPVGGKIIHNIKIRGANGQPNEEYFKWQFIASITASGLYAKDYIGCEISFPKGNKTSAPIRMDAAIFDDVDWINRYNAFL